MLHLVNFEGSGDRSEVSCFLKYCFWYIWDRWIKDVMLSFSLTNLPLSMYVGDDFSRRYFASRQIPLLPGPSPETAPAGRGPAGNRKWISVPLLSVPCSAPAQCQSEAILADCYPKSAFLMKSPTFINHKEWDSWKREWGVREPFYWLQHRAKMDVLYLSCISVGIYSW